MSGQGSTGNVIAALASFFIPGLGQLLQGRLLMAAFQFVLGGVLWLLWLGWVVPYLVDIGCGLVQGVAIRGARDSR